MIRSNNNNHKYDFINKEQMQASRKFERKIFNLFFFLRIHGRQMVQQKLLGFEISDCTMLMVYLSAIFYAA